MKRGETKYLFLEYEINGQPLEPDAYDELEVQINKEGSFNSIKKLLSRGEILYGDVVYVDEENVQHVYTGYYIHLDQEETFLLSTGKNNIQFRVSMNGEVGESDIADLLAEQALSVKVLDVAGD